MLVKQLFSRTILILTGEVAIKSNIGIVQNWYDDWYVYSINTNNKSTYGLLKMREEENDGFDIDDACISISFAKYNIDSLSNSLINGKVSNYFDNEIEFVINVKLAKHDSNLEAYKGYNGIYVINQRAVWGDK